MECDSDQCVEAPEKSVSPTPWAQPDVTHNRKDAPFSPYSHTRCIASATWDTAFS